MLSFLHNTFSYLSQVFKGLRQLKHFRLSYLRKVFAFFSRREKIALALLALLAVANALWSIRNFYVAHTVERPSMGGVFTEGFIGQPTYINPLLAHTETDTSLVSLIFSELYSFGSNGELTPDLAEGQPVISEDQKQYTVKLKQNVKWHNDKQFTADDVLFTVNAIKDPSYKSPLRPLWSPVTVEKIDDYTVKFSQKDVSGPFIYNLTLPILPRNVWNKIDSQNFLLNEANLKAIGTGPYAIREIQKLPSGKVQSITMDSYANYYGGRAKIDSIIAKFYDTDQDLVNALHGREIESLGFVALDRGIHIDSNNDAVRQYIAPLPQYQVVFFNLKNKALGDQAVRQALQTAADRSKIIEDIFKQNARVPASPWSGQQTTAYADQDKAIKILEDAGWKIDPKTNIRTRKNIPLEFTVTTNDFLLNSKAAETLANQWRQLGAKVNLSVLPTKQVTDTIIPSRGFDVLVFPQKFGADPDPFIFWHSSQVKTPGLNISGFADQNLDKLIVQARTTTNQQARKEAYKKFDSIMSEKIPAFFLTQTQYMYYVSNGVYNVGIHSLFEPAERFNGITDWYMETKRVWAR